MSDFIKKLEAELAGAAYNRDTLHSLEKGEKPIVVFKDDVELRKIFSLWKEYDEKKDRAVLAGKYAPDEASRRQAEIAQDMAGWKVTFWRAAFWYAVSERYNLFGKEVSLRSGYQLVECHHGD